jgi:predicted O-methyltransferase YrrM
MSLQKYFDKLVPRAVSHYSTLLWDRVAFEHLQSAPCDTRCLAPLAALDLRVVFGHRDLDDEWRAVESRIAELGITSSAGGVNHGDRRALYYLVRHLRPRSVLEVGTHVGASTVHIASALAALRAEEPGTRYELTTVDIVDVNDAKEQPWRKLGSKYSPAEMIERLGFADFVRFRVQSSIEYLASCSERFDLAFLDGFHTASHVLREIPATLPKLRPGGYVLLHDYYPEQKPLWSDGHVERGPYLAAERLRRGGADIAVKPLGALPWPTKADSNVTSLALLGRA